MWPKAVHRSATVILRNGLSYVLQKAMKKAAQRAAFSETVKA